MVTVPLAADAALNVHVEVRLVALNVPGEQAVVIPEGEEDVSVTVPVNPPMGERVIDEDPVLPALNVMDVGFAASPKSGVAGAVAVTAMEAE
jgi:hypothetical protein